MKSSLRAATIALGFVLLPGCAALKTSDFAANGPVFDPMKFFTGRTASTGVIENRGGAPMLRVTTKTVGRRQGEVLELEQDLVVGEEKPQHRSWQIRKLDAHRFEATANDVIGTIRGEAYGNVFHWSFTLARTPGNPLGNLRMSQWMYLQPDGRTMINHSTLRKFGVVVGQVTEQFRRQ